MVFSDITTDKLVDRNEKGVIKKKKENALFIRNVSNIRFLF